jgi:3-oxoacyl-(acyl-carrier-protein) synthase
MQRASVVLAGGVEELCEETFLSFHELSYLSGTDGSTPVSRPFDARRNGIILSEGAAVVVLEDPDYASLRGAEVLAVVKGLGSSFAAIGDRDSSHEGRGLRNAITLALRDAALSPGDIDYISASANSTRGLDRMETNVIKEVFGRHAFKVPVSSIKSMVGESFSASGSLAMASAVGAINKGFTPPTVNYQERDPECDLDYVPGASRQNDINNVLVLASDPHGNSSAIVLGKYEG